MKSRLEIIYNAITSRPYLTLFIFWLVLYSWHIFTLGFYTDDWYYATGLGRAGYGDAFSWDRLLWYINHFGSRGPLLALVWYLSSSLNFTLMPEIYHLFASILILLSSIALYRLYREIFIFLGMKGAKRSGLLASMLWTASPWILGITNWITVQMSLYSLIFFVLSGYWIFRQWNRGSRALWLPGLFSLITFLFFEGFFMQFLVFLILGLIRALMDKKKLSDIFLPFVGIVVAQIIAMVWNRISIGLFVGTVDKTICPFWLQVFAANIASLPYALLSALGWFSIIIIPVGLWLAFRLIRHIFAKPWKTNPLFLRYFFYAVAGITGVLLSLGLYAVAGYTVWGLGARSRVFYALSLWLPFLSVLGIHYLLINKLIRPGAYYTVIFALVLVFASSHILRSTDWAASWALQQEIAESVPEEIMQTDDKAIIIFDGPYRYNWVPVMDANWAISVQLKHGCRFFGRDNAPDLGQRRFVVGRGQYHTYFNTPFINIWDGEFLRQQHLTPEGSNSVSWNAFLLSDKYKASELWTWDYDKGKLARVTGPDTLEFRQYENYDYWMTALYNRIFR